MTQAQYEALALDQVTELWTSFGDLTEIWLDGGCGAMCDKVGALVKKTNAKDAVAFNGGGVSDSPVRWCGTEQGIPKKGPGGAVWSTSDCGWCPAGSGPGSAPNATAATWHVSALLCAVVRLFDCMVVRLCSCVRACDSATTRLRLHMRLHLLPRVLCACACACAGDGVTVLRCYGAGCYGTRWAYTHLLLQSCACLFTTTISRRVDS